MIRIKRYSTIMSVAFLLAAQAGSLCAAEPLNLDDDNVRINYSLGHQIGGDFKRQGVKIDAEAIIKGIEDALSGAEPMMSPQDMHATLMALKRKVVADERTNLRKNRREAELQYLAEGKQFMQENAAKPDVKTTTSGLQYKIVEPGAGKTPKPSDEVTVNYRGTLINGNEFDSSDKHGEPATFKLDGVIKGWTEGLQLIKEGGKIQLFIPPELAYGDRGPLGHRTLIFDVELISVGAEKQAGSVQGTQTQNKQ